MGFCADRSASHALLGADISCRPSCLSSNPRAKSCLHVATGKMPTSMMKEKSRKPLSLNTLRRVFWRGGLTWRAAQEKERRQLRQSDSEPVCQSDKWPSERCSRSVEWAACCPKRGPVEAGEGESSPCVHQRKLVADREPVKVGEERSTDLRGPCGASASAPRRSQVGLGNENRVTAASTA
jgi:hypothetical protein